MADYSIYFKKDEQDLLMKLKAIQFYYKQIDEPEKFNVSKIMKAAIKRRVKKEEKQLNNKGIDIVQLYKDYKEKQDEISWKIKSKTKYPEGEKMIEDKMEGFNDGE